VNERGRLTGYSGSRCTSSILIHALNERSRKKEERKTKNLCLQFPRQRRSSCFCDDDGDDGYHGYHGDGGVDDDDGDGEEEDG
jgi:hypothetical protein